MAGLANDVRSCGGKRTRATQGQSDVIDPEPTQRPASNRKTFVTSKSRLDCQDEHRRHFNCWNETVVAAESAKLKAEGLLGLAQLWPPQSRSIERAAPAIGSWRCRALVALLGQAGMHAARGRCIRFAIAAAASSVIPRCAAPRHWRQPQRRADRACATDDAAEAKNSAFDDGPRGGARRRVGALQGIRRRAGRA
jgi:hypothetical protein